MKYSALFFVVVSLTCSANIGPAGFEQFKNDYFVETGTYKGKGIKLALRARFKEIRSIEILRHHYEQAKKTFANKVNVHLYLGDSGKDLYDIISDIEKPITFWLDGHNGKPDPNGGKNTPLLEELEQIGYHHIKTHTILIDDMHCAGGVLFDFITKEEIIAKILEINPNYTIRYVDGGDRGEWKNNVMVAQVR